MSRSMICDHFYLHAGNAKDLNAVGGELTAEEEVHQINLTYNRSTPSNHFIKGQCHAISMILYRTYHNENMQVPYPSNSGFG